MSARRLGPVAAALLLLAAAPLALEALAPGTGRALVARLSAYRAEHAVAGAALLVLVQALVASVGIVPASLIGVAAGALFGPGLGFLLAAAGTMSGALLGFAFARRVLRPRAGRGLGGKLARLDARLADEGWRLVCLLRLSPVMPFAPTSLALGASAVSIRGYVLGTLASLPALFAYVALGALGGGLASSGGGPAEALRGALLLVGAGATLALGWRLRRLLGPDPGDAAAGRAHAAGGAPAAGRARAAGAASSGSLPA